MAGAATLWFCVEGHESMAELESASSAITGDRLAVHEAKPVLNDEGPTCAYILRCKKESLRDWRIFGVNLQRGRKSSNLSRTSSTPSTNFFFPCHVTIAISAP